MAVTDAKGCTATASITITQPTAITLSGTTTNVSCFGGNDGAIDLTATGGTGTLTFAWNNGATTEDLATLVAGAYSVTVTDANACSASASFTITQPALLVASVASTGNVNCNGGSNGFINVTVAGGVTNYTYSWSNGASIQNLVNIPAGTYTLTVTDAHGCTATTGATISEPAVLTASITIGTIACNGGTTSVDLTVSGGTTAYSYFWNNGATTEDLAAVGAGTYTVAVTDAKGCTATASTTITQPAAIGSRQL
ncbi:MAG: SprB repeat-containing protein [Chitinophagales bacterium]